MNSSNVLSKIMKLLAFQKVALEGAQSEDGTIYESPSFEVGDEINTVSEDGTTTPARDGSIEVIIENEDGEEEGAIITIKDGKITAVSEHPEESEDDEDNEPEDDEAESDNKENKTEQHMKRARSSKFNSLAGDDISSKKGPAEQTGTPKPLAQTDDKKEPVTMDDLMEAYSKLEAAHTALATKLDDLEAAHENHKTALSEVTSKVHDIEEHLEDMDEEMGRIDIDKAPEVDKENIHPNQMARPKLGGAPVNASAQTMKNNNNVKSADLQGAFLSKLYN